MFNEVRGQGDTWEEAFAAADAAAARDKLRYAQIDAERAAVEATHGGRKK